MMPRLNPLRPVTAEERQELEQIVRSRTEAIRRVERARIILALANGLKAREVAEQYKVCEASVHYRRKRFNEAGLAGLEDLPRSGRPETYDATQHGQIVLTAKTNPKQLGMSFGHWTLDRLVEYVNERLEIAISRSQLADVLKQEGLKWYQEKTYFSESPDPQFVEKRGRL
jgi:transposase